jgi:hypothetical protein
VPSSTHQWLVIWAARRMTRDGFVVSGFDGRAPRGEEWSSLPSPFVFQGVRADAWGQRTLDQKLAFGEAKTFSDVDTDHTRRQLDVLGKTRMKKAKAYCPLYIAVPRSAVYELDRVLIDVGLLRAKNVVRLHIPDILVEEVAHGSRQTYCTPA